MKNTGIILFSLLSLTVTFSYSKEVPFTLEDRDRIIRMETKLNEIDRRFEQIDRRFEQIDKRFEQIDKRFEQIDKRFDDVNNRIGDVITFIWIISGIFTAMTISTIGFAIWDRRSMIRPFEDKVKEIEEKKIRTLIEVLKDIAKVDSNVAEVLKRFNIL